MPYHGVYSTPDTGGDKLIMTHKWIEDGHTKRAMLNHIDAFEDTFEDGFGKKFNEDFGNYFFTLTSVLKDVIRTTPVRNESS